MLASKFHEELCYCRSASVAAAASVRSIADDEDNVDSGSSDEAWKKGVNEVDESSVWLIVFVFPVLHFYICAQCGCFF